jgi:site-specific DNA-methyltransferase (adenine-specific)
LTRKEVHSHKGGQKTPKQAAGLQGSLYLHCDWHTDAYIRIHILDRLSGIENFRNEIVWSYTGRLMYSAKNFCEKHDIIYFYAKTKSYKLNEITEPVNEQDYIRMKKQEVHIDEDGENGYGAMRVREKP